MNIEVVNYVYLKLNNWMQTDDYEEHLKNEKKLRNKLDKFLKKFDIPKIKTLSLDEYVIGKENHKSFCYYVEYELKNYGSISGSTPSFTKYVIYWSKKKKGYSFGNKNRKRRKNFGDNFKTIFENVKIQIIDVIDATLKKDYKRIVENPLNPQFKNKISFLYDSENQFPSYSDNDLNILLRIFDISDDYKCDRFYKRQKIFKFYTDNGFNSLVTPYLFMSFIYGFYGFRSILRTKQKIFF